MGINIKGFATSIKVSDFLKIAETIGVNVWDTYEHSTFEDAISTNNTDENDIYFTETVQGTIITTGEDVPTLDFPIKQLSENGMALKFLWGETSGVYVFTYYEKGKVVRTLGISGKKQIKNSGKALEIEYAGMDMPEIINALIKKVTGDNLDSLPTDAKSVRYTFKSFDKPITQQPTVPLATTKRSDKPWWKFW